MKEQGDRDVIDRRDSTREREGEKEGESKESGGMTWMRKMSCLTALELRFEVREREENFFSFPLPMTGGLKEPSYELLDT